jgi:ABC-type glycerol-3-phosphate transport system permease component
MADETHRPPDTEEPPPFGGSWKNLYAAVLVNLFVLVALFYLFKRYFSG